MQSVLTITEPETELRLTTLARVKAELDIKVTGFDDVLTSKIDEASSDIITALGFAVASEDVVETFRNDVASRINYGAGYGYHYGGHQVDSGALFLRRKAVSAITSVTLDDTPLTAPEYYLDPDKGTVNRLDTSGYPCDWCFSKSLIVAYTAGYVLPGNEGANLPAGIEGMAVDLVKSFWFNRTRDPLIKSEDIPGVRTVEYWVGAVGDPDQLPPEIQRKVSLYRRPRMAVA